jgi:serpin B
MKIRILIVAWLAGFAPFLQVSASPTDEQKLVAANNGFAFKLIKQLSQDQPAANIFISPYSAATVLQMVANGAVGQTKMEMQQALGTVGMPASTASAAYKAIASSLRNASTNVLLTTANAIWYRQGAPVNPAYIANSQSFYDATVAPLNVFDPHAAEVINTWVSEKTHGKITQLADGSMFQVDQPRLFLVNAVYFKGKWADPFKVEDTKDRPFHLRAGGQKKIPMMAQSKTFTYRRGTGYQAVRLPYEGENLAMYVFLPDTNSSPEKLLDILDGAKWRRVTKPGFVQKDGLLVLPKFKLEYSVDLRPPLQAMGMKMAFQDQADFSGIAPGLSIGAARQKAFVDVNEEGTEATAATVVMLADSAMPMPPPVPFEMIVDRPFLFLIEDSQTETILFMGVLFDPQAD